MSGSAEGRRMLGQILKDHGAIRESDVQRALAEQRKQGGLLGQLLSGRKGGRRCSDHP